MAYKRVLTVQDISCFGQCSLTVALPILSACGSEAVILPSAVLSTYTSNFKNYTFRDLTEDIPSIEKHWISEGIKFDAIYTGYLGNKKQIDYVESLIKNTLKDEALVIIDPVVGDNGHLYPGFNDEYVAKVKQLSTNADYLIPNITEASFLTGMPYKKEYDESYILELFNKMSEFCKGTIVLTGVSYDKETTGIAIYKDGQIQYYKHRLIDRNCHGTGDIFASSFTGALMQGKTPFEACKIAADFILASIENTIGCEEHWYGVRFELELPNLIKDVRGI